MLCRLTPPLCLNFLGLIHLDGHVTGKQDMVETSYTSVSIKDIYLEVNNCVSYFEFIVKYLLQQGYYEVQTKLKILSQCCNKKNDVQSAPKKSKLSGNSPVNGYL